MVRISTQGSRLARDGHQAEITVATDGACQETFGGWGWVATDGGSDSGAQVDTTNNQMELQAVIEALRHYGDRDVLILTDSRYVLGCLTEWIDGWRARGWRNSAGKPVSNQELIVAADELIGPDVVFAHVRGHAGHPLNEQADYLAQEEARRAKGR